MNRLDRLVLGRFISILFGCLLAIAIVFVAVDYIGAIRIWNDRSAAEIRRYYLAAIPYILFLVSPIAVLLASMFTIAGFSRRLELMAMLGAGRPLWRILAPIWLAGIAYSGVWVWVMENIMPDANHTRVQIRTPRNRGAFNDTPFRTDFAYKAGPLGTFFFKDYSGTSREGNRVTFSRIDTAGKLRERIDAEKATWTDSGWRFVNGLRHEFDSTGKLQRYSKIDSLLLAIPKAQAEDLISNRVFPDEMNSKELQTRINAMRQAGEPTMAYESEAEFKKSAPWVIAIVTLIGTALAALVGRRGQALAFGIGILLAFSFYVALRIGLALGHAGTLTPLVSAWWSHVVFLVIGLALLARASRS